jgi:hypothetical protein
LISSLCSLVLPAPMVATQIVNMHCCWAGCRGVVSLAHAR